MVVVVGIVRCGCGMGGVRGGGRCGGGLWRLLWLLTVRVDRVAGVAGMIVLAACCILSWSVVWSVWWCVSVGPCVGQNRNVDVLSC